jgi:hypothetical protein
MVDNELLDSMKRTTQEQARIFFSLIRSEQSQLPNLPPINEQTQTSQSSVSTTIFKNNKTDFINFGSPDL